jgi:hypothetical protein
VEIDAIVGLLLLALWLYCIFDVISTDSAAVRNLPKGLWLVLVLILPDIGALAWLMLGRPEKVGWRPGDTEPRRPRTRRPLGPEDSHDFIAGIEARDRQLKAWAEEDRAAAEREKARLDPANVNDAPPDARTLAEWEADLARREAEFRRSKEGPAAPPD